MDTILWLLATAFHVTGIACAAYAVYTARSPQGAIAWAMTLIFMPYIAVPLYLVLGRAKFRDYVRARRAEDLVYAGHSVDARDPADSVRSRLPDDAGALHALDELGRMPFTEGNDVELLIDGKATFDSIFAGIDTAKEYVLVQFYILRDDQLGRALRDRLAAAASKGVKVYFLYDEIGSHSLPAEYLNTARAAGIDIRSFHTTQGQTNRFQLNFRNHRKIVVVDGHLGFVGGHNVGDEYLGLDRKVGPWRDTHVRIAGPMVLGLQMSFAEDWHWRTKSIPEELDWSVRRSENGNANGLIVASGPADSIETCAFLYSHLIHSARKRVWIASPYFVPDQAALVAMKLAALRGLDVRLLVPKNNDSKLVDMGSRNHIDAVADSGVQVMRYKEGFMHQKVLLLDDVGSAVGTANMDNRSFRLNFEVMAVIVDRDFASEMEKMFEADMARCEPVDPDEFEKAPFHFRFAAKVARLFAPIL